MKICPNCNRRNPKFYTECPKCKTVLPDSYVTTLAKEKNREINNLNLAKEYRRTCLSCGKVWHSLINREKNIESSQMYNATQQCGGSLQSIGTCGMCGTGNAIQAQRNLDANLSEIQRLRQCPQCHSANYNEIIVE